MQLFLHSWGQQADWAVELHSSLGSIRLIICLRCSPPPPRAAFFSMVWQSSTCCSTHSLWKVALWLREGRAGEAALQPGAPCTAAAVGSSADAAGGWADGSFGDVATWGSMRLSLCHPTHPGSPDSVTSKAWHPAGHGHDLAARLRCAMPPSQPAQPPTLTWPSCPTRCGRQQSRSAAVRG